MQKMYYKNKELFLKLSQQLNMSFEGRVYSFDLYKIILKW